MSPHMDRVRRLVTQSKTLQHKMTAKDTATWSKVMNQEQALLNISPSQDQKKQLQVAADQSGSSEKRKICYDLDVDIDKLYACQYAQCPQSELCMGFHDKTSRVNHEFYCDYRTDQGQVPFHDYLSGDTTLPITDDWINMGLEGTNQNQDHNVDIVEHVNELGLGRVGFYINNRRLWWHVVK